MVRRFSIAASGWLASLIARLPGVKEDTGPPKTVPPTQDEVALAFSQALLTSGVYRDDPAAAVIQAWWLVNEYYGGRAEFVRTIQFLPSTAAARSSAPQAPADDETFTA